MPTVSMILFVILVLVLDSMTHFIMTLSIFRLIPAPVITGPDLQSVVDITVLSNTGGRNLGYQHPITQYTVIKVPNSAGDGNGGSNEGKNPTKPKYTPKIHEAPPPNNIAINPSPGSSSPKVKNRFNQVATQEKSKNQDLNTQIPTVATDPRFAPEKEPEKRIILTVGR